MAHPRDFFGSLNRCRCKRVEPMIASAIAYASLSITRFPFNVHLYIRMIVVRPEVPGRPIAG